MLEAVASTARTTLEQVEGIRTAMATAKQRMRAEVPRLCSQDLLNNLFRHPYTRIDVVARDPEITRQTATKDRHELAVRSFVSKNRMGRNNYDINRHPVQLLLRASGELQL